MEWPMWLPLLIGIIPLVGWVRAFLKKGARTTPKVYQEEMTRRHTPKRIADTKVELANWEVDFTTLELQLALEDYAPLDGAYVSSKVLTWCYEHDRARFDIFMAHNNRLDLHNLGYDPSAPKRISEVKAKGEYNAKRHSDYY